MTSDAARRPRDVRATCSEPRGTSSVFCLQNRRVTSEATLQPNPTRSRSPTADRPAQNCFVTSSPTLLPDRAPPLLLSLLPLPRDTARPKLDYIPLHTPPARSACPRLPTSAPLELRTRPSAASPRCTTSISPARCELVLRVRISLSCSPLRYTGPRRSAPPLLRGRRNSLQGLQVVSTYKGLGIHGHTTQTARCYQELR